ncbi:MULTISPECIES: SDR family oxidoreductase [Streptomyces]|uniref:SDR family oxidoreductase n=2 Tax=Streptomyces TaxID=1883 RepID=A0ABV9JCZ3_9ACTN
MADMTDKVCVVTGANSGIGKMTAVGLAKAGATVVMACRDLARSSEALAGIRTLSGSDQVHLMQLDLASQVSIRAFVEAFTQRFDRLDVLVNNAGVGSPARKLTADGFELHFGVNHLGSFLLTTLLLPVLERSAPSRVIVVAGSAQKSGKINWDDLQLEQKYSILRAGGQSKLANLMFVRALAQRAQGVTVNAVDPGMTATGITRELPAPVHKLMGLLFKSPEKGARTPVYLATSSEAADVTGKYFKNSREIQPNPDALDDNAVQRLWRISEKLTAQSATAP